MYFYYRAAGLVFESDCKFGSLAETDGRNADVEIRHRDFLPPEDSVVVENLTRLSISPKISMDDAGFTLDWLIHGAYRIEEGKRIFYNSQARSSAQFEHLMVNEVIASVFFQRNFFLLHASAAMLPDGRSVITFGEPGAGKSTTLGMFVKYGAEVLTDEVAAIDFDTRGKPRIWPFVPILRLWDGAARRLGYVEDDRRNKYEFPQAVANDGRPCEVRAFISLRKSEVFEVCKTTGVRALLDLNGNFTLPPQVMSPSEEIKRFKQITRLLETCDLYQVKRGEDSFDDMEAFVKGFF